METKTQIRDNLFHKHMAEATAEGLENINRLLVNKEYIGTYFDWYEISYRENGFPDFSEKYNNRKTNYASAFGIDEKAKIKVSNLHNFNTYLEYALSNEHIKNYFKHPNDDKYMLMEFGILSFVESAIDRYIHLNNTTEFELEKFNPIYIELENGIFSDVLKLEVYVPILFVKLDFESKIIGEGIRIERMNDLFQLARVPSKYSHDVHPLVASSATHALLMSGWELKNTNYWQLLMRGTGTSRELINKIDEFFGVLRVVHGLKTGYSQVILKKVNWSHGYTANLPNLSKTSIRSYPLEFENLYWSKNFSVTNLNFGQLKKIWDGIENIQDNKLKVSLKRLNQCLLRNEEEDSILDATIAMEVLLSDRQPQEMTHKLAMRVAALSKLSKIEDSAMKVFRNIKKIYSYRSSIVHGSKKTNKKREIKISVDKSIPTLEMAILYLRMIIETLIENPQYLEPEKIDEQLLLQTKGT